MAERVWEGYGRTNSLISNLLVSVALLHDVIEDSSVTEEYLSNMGVSDPVVNAVKMLTHPDGESYLDYIVRVRADPIARPVKFADIRHNLQTSTGTMKDKYELALYILRFGK